GRKAGLPSNGRSGTDSPDAPALIPEGSRRIGSCRRRGCELPGDVAVEHRRPDVMRRALDLGPDLAADVGPALAEGEVLGEIRPRRRIDHAFEQREAVLARRQRVVRMLAEEL